MSEGNKNKKAPQPLPRKTDPKPRSIEAQVKRLKKAGLTEREIAKITDRPKTTIHNIIHRSFTSEELEEYTKGEKKALQAFRSTFSSIMTRRDIKRMIQYRGMTDYKIALDAEKQLDTQHPDNIPNITINIMSNAPCNGTGKAPINQPINENKSILIASQPEGRGSPNTHSTSCDVVPIRQLEFKSFSEDSNEFRE